MNLEHSGHDFAILLDRWRAVAQRRGWTLTELTKEGGLPVLAVENPVSAGGGRAGGLYLSAGVHGDECASVWGLLQWAEGGDALPPEELPLLIFPCLNPHGLVANTRSDHRGLDLNRHFHDAGHPLVARWQRFLEGRRFEAALLLHEDYDATGIYLYELVRGGSFGEELLRTCEEVVPRETAAEIEGRPFCGGLMTAGEDIARAVAGDLEGGLPEALHLFFHHADSSLTFETPSELDLGRRVEAQRRFLEAAVARICG